MAAKVNIPNEINVESLEFGKPEKLGGYHKSHILGEYTTDQLLIHSPLLDIVSLGGSRIELAISGIEPKSVEFYKLVVNLEKHALKSIYQNSETWFGKTIPSEKLRTMFHSCVYPTSDLSKNTFRIKLSKNSSIFKESKKNKITLADLTNLSLESFRISCIFKLDGILFGRNSCKLDTRVIQILVKQKTPKLSGPQISNISDTEEGDSDLEDNVFQVKDSPIDKPTIIDTTLGHESEPLEEDEKPELKKQEDIPQCLEIGELNMQLENLTIQAESAIRNCDTDRIGDIMLEIKEIKNKIAELGAQKE